MGFLLVSIIISRIGTIPNCYGGHRVSKSLKNRLRPTSFSRFWKQNGRFAVLLSVSARPTWASENHSVIRMVNQPFLKPANEEGLSYYNKKIIDARHRILITINFISKPCLKISGNLISNGLFHGIIFGKIIPKFFSKETKYCIQYINSRFCLDKKVSERNNEITILD